jgi:hypothetical protein
MFRHKVFSSESGGAQPHAMVRGEDMTKDHHIKYTTCNKDIILVSLMYTGVRNVVARN